MIHITTTKLAKVKYSDALHLISSCVAKDNSDIKDTIIPPVDIPKTNDYIYCGPAAPAMPYIILRIIPAQILMIITSIRVMMKNNFVHVAVSTKTNISVVRKHSNVKLRLKAIRNERVTLSVR